MFIYIFFVKTDFDYKQSQELANGISKILLCLQTMECLLWFPMFIYIFLVKADFGSMWHGVARGPTRWYGVVPGSTEWYGVVWSGTWRYWMVRSRSGVMDPALDILLVNGGT